VTDKQTDGTDVTLADMADVVISELLCFLTNYFGKVAKSVLITNVAGFYEENEIVEVKRSYLTLSQP